MPPNLVTLFAHVMSHANEGGRGSVAHSWDEVLQPSAASGTTSPGPFPMSAQDWRKAEAFSLHLQSLIAARHIRCTSNGNSRVGAGHSNGDAPSSSSAMEPSGAAAAAASAPSSAQVSSLGNSAGKDVPVSNSRLKGKARSPATAHASQAVGAASVAAGAATPNPGVNWPRHHIQRVTPKEPCRAGEPSAPMKPVARLGGSRRQSSAEGAVASLAVSRAGPGAFETPSHSSYHHTAPPGASSGDNLRGREHSPSRYPARLRSRRFPQLGGGGESPEPPQPRGFGYGAETMGDGDHTLDGARRLSPRQSHMSLVRGGGKFPGLSPDHPQLDWRGAASGEDVSAGLQHAEHRDDGQSFGMRTRAAPKAATAQAPENASIMSPSGACTPQVGTGAAPPPLMGGGAAVGSSPREEVAPPARPRQVLQGGRSGGRPTPVPRSSVGGRNYTDNHVKQLVMIEAAVVASATAKDRAMYNLPRQGRTLTLTNVFKFVALRGAGVMYSLATEKQVEAHTGRHSNFFDGKIDARIVGIIKRDIGDEAITKSRKFSKILLSLVAEGESYMMCNGSRCLRVGDPRLLLVLGCGFSCLEKSAGSRAT